MSTIVLSGAVLGSAASSGTHVAYAQAVQIAGVPFAATQVITRTTRARTEHTEGRVARNRAGSTYVEEVDPTTGRVSRALIVDVPGKRLITLDLERRLYTVQLVPQLHARSVPVGWVGDQLRWAEEHRNLSHHEIKGNVNSTQTWLGTRQVSGLLTIGTAKERRSALAAAGSAREPAIEVDESWFSVELGLSVLMTERKPRTGDVVEVMLTRVLRTDPESSLFMIPPGFAPAASLVEVPSTPVDGI